MSEQKFSLLANNFRNCLNEDLELFPKSNYEIISLPDHIKHLEFREKKRNVLILI